MNKVILLGRLTKDPEVRYTESQKLYATFGIAVRKRFKQEGGADADFINCIAWNKTAELIRMYFKKGNQIGVIGRIETDAVQGNDGKNTYYTKVIVEEITFVDSKKDAAPEEGVNFEELNQDEFKIDVEE